MNDTGLCLVLSSATFTPRQFLKNVTILLAGLSSWYQIEKNPDTEHAYTDKAQNENAYGPRICNDYISQAIASR